MIAFDFLRAWPGSEYEIEYGDRETILYALSIGLGGGDPEQLHYVFEKRLVAAPTLPMVLATRLPWLRLPESGLDLRRMLHGETSIELFDTVPVTGHLKVRSRIRQVVDRGPKGAAVYFENDLMTMKGGILARVSGCMLFLEGGGPGDPDTVRKVPVLAACPERDPDAVCDQWLPANAAELYRLNGDRTPLHVDPEAARVAKLEKPLLHGLCTFGYAATALLQKVAAFDAGRVKRMAVRFSAPMYPGETLRTEIFDLGKGEYAFQCRSVERNRLVLSHGSATIGEAR